MFERTAIPGGPRVISERLPGARSASIAAYVVAGSRLEAPTEAGTAHFLEHLNFKGTTRYPTARAISEAIEGVGGNANAATDRESTVYYARVPLRETERAMDVLGELVCRPTLADAEIEQERTVIIEEIRSYFDDPAEHAQILWQLAMFGDGPLGREICGDEDGIRALPAETIRDFWRRAYRPSNVVIAACGDLGHDELVGLAAPLFGTDSTAPAPADTPAPLAFEPAPALPSGERFLRATRETSQASLVVGVPGLRRDHPDTWILSVLNTILGEGMSSRLFLSVREEKALAYDVGSGVVDYADAGALTISAGVDPASLGKALDAILAELARLTQELVPGAELAKAVAYLSGGLELRLEETRHVASWLGGQEALSERVYTIDEALRKIAAVTPDEIARVAGELFRRDALRLAVVAPPRHGLRLDAHLVLPA